MGFENNNISIPFHWGVSVWVVTILVLITLIVAEFYILSLKNWPTWMLWLKYLLTIVFIATIIIGVFYTPIRLKANNEKITVTRLFYPLEMPINEIVEIKQIPKSYIDGSIKTCGSDGLFGYLGRFKNKRLGNYSMYATELNNLILVHTRGRKYVFSCSRYEELIEYVNIRLKQN